MPLDPKLQKFTTASPVIASYSYSDAAAGILVQLYYGMNSEDSVGQDYHLTKQVQYSSSEGTTHSGDTAAVDLDFDFTPFDLTQRIEGTATVSLGVYYQSVATGTGNLTGTVSVRHWDGATETVLVTNTIPTTAVGSGDAAAKTHVIPLVIPLTIFATGDTLRVTVTLSLPRTGGAGNMVVGLGHDPQNRDWAAFIAPSGDDTVTTQLRCYIPFKLDL